MSLVHNEPDTHISDHNVHPSFPPQGSPMALSKEDESKFAKKSGRKEGHISASMGK